MRGLNGFAAFLLVAIMSFAPAWAQERIYSFDSVIRVNEDASLTVTETIAVEARGQEIKRGIYRDFPTVYPQPDGSRQEARFEIVEVLRDGAPEPWFTKGDLDGIRVYFGREDVFLEPGRHVYKLTYRTTRQLRFFEDHDELYWNVNGNGWRFPADKVNATVLLPSGARMLDRTAYSGYIGEARDDWRAGEDAEGNPTFETTMAFPARMGLTIVVSFPKGHIAYPTERQKLVWLFMDNLHWVAAGGLLLAGNSVGLDRPDASRLIRAVDALEYRLGQAFDDTHFSRNWAYAIAGAAQSVVVFFAFVVAAMMANIVEGVFVAIGALVILVLLNILFRKLLYAPTLVGREALDRIAGFRMYLETAEEARLNLASPPGRTPELFERYLPYAMALDVENQWAAKFQDVLQAATAAGGSSYRPGWYDNRSDLAGGFATAAFARGLSGGLAGSFASATRSSGSSSSGFSSGSGGGSSGGGGGGGGGGGW